MTSLLQNKMEVIVIYIGTIVLKYIALETNVRIFKEV